MTNLAILLMTTAVPSADPVAQPPPDSPQRFSRLRRLFGRQSQGPQRQPGSAWGGPPGGAVQPVPIAAGPITPPVMSQGPQQQPGSAWVGPPGGAVQPVPIAASPITPPVMSQGPQQRPGCACGVRPVPVAVAPSAAGPITAPVMSQGPQQQPGGAAGGPPGGAGRLVPVPVSGTPSATGPSPAMSRPEVTTPPVPPEMRRMPVGPADPF